MAIKLEELLTRLDGRQEKMIHRQEAMNVTLVRQQASLEEHMRRTAANEESLALMKEAMSKLRNDSVTWPFLGKIFSAIIPLAGTIIGILKAMGKI